MKILAVSGNHLIVVGFALLAVGILGSLLLYKLIKRAVKRGTQEAMKNNKQ